MPIYEYECTGCAHRFEMKRSFNETDVVSCPRCGCSTQRIFSSVPIIFKGTGFYVTDNRVHSHATPADGADGVKADSQEKKS